MLIRFEVANFRSILEPVELSMVAVDRDREAARNVPGLGESLLPLAGVYGPNASGKSNVLAALVWLRLAVSDSLRFWEDGIPVEPFAAAVGTGRTSDFTVEYVIDDVRFEYSIELDDAAIHYEGLFHYPERKRRRVFEREGPDLKIQRGLGAISGARELLTERTLVLSAARRFDEPTVRKFAGALLEMQVRGGRRVGSRKIPYYTPLTPSTRLFGSDDTGRPSAKESDRARALAMLRMADLGIDDVSIDEVDAETYAADGESRALRRWRTRLIHRLGETAVPFEMESESAGTRTWFNLIGPVLSALDSGSQMVFDELDTTLHPVLSSQLLRLFRDPETNPRGAQLIFASHDTSLLDHLNRDEVWLTEKGGSGATELTALAEFSGERVRSSEKLESGYLNGRFGGLPDVDRAEMLRALGLIG